MSRSYKGNKLKKNRVYSGADLQRVFGVCANTISNWVNGGLIASDGKRPYLFRGGQVMEFLRTRQERAKTTLLPGEFKCGVCKSAVFPDVATLQIGPAKNGAAMGMGTCLECGGHIRKFVCEADFVIFERLRDPNTTVGSLHEGMWADNGGIGISKQKLDQHWHAENDRTLYQWQFHAGHLVEQTIDQHLAAIRFFEDVLDGKPFEKLTIRDVDLVRSALKDAISA